jgi:dUTP pyrophosphatase
MPKIRGFEVVSKDFRTAFNILTDEKKNKISIPVDIKLPARADERSAGYDFYAPKDVQILPNHTVVFFTDVKAYMQPDEVLKIYIRSSLAIKKGLVLSNGVGIIDSSYYNNPDNDGNIAMAIKNTSGTAVTIAAGDRIAQGIFVKYLTADEDTKLNTERTGGIGSSGE